MYKRNIRLARSHQLRLRLLTILVISITSMGILTLVGCWSDDHYDTIVVTRSPPLIPDPRSCYGIPCVIAASDRASNTSQPCAKDTRYHCPSDYLCVPTKIICTEVGCNERPEPFLCLAEHSSCILGNHCTIINLSHMAEQETVVQPYNRPPAQIILPALGVGFGSLIVLSLLITSRSNYWSDRQLSTILALTDLGAILFTGTTIVMLLILAIYTEVTVGPPHRSCYAWLQPDYLPSTARLYVFLGLGAIITAVNMTLVVITLIFD